jgi:acyl carrier protein
MIPANFELLEVMPLTFNGKIDRIALAKLDLLQIGLGNNFVKPRTLIEQRLSDIWVQVMNLKQVSIHDNFFELGGHSLMATQVIYLINQAFEFKLPVRDLYEKPTVAELAEHVTMLRWAVQNQLIVSNDTQDNSINDYFYDHEEIIL